MLVLRNIFQSLRISLFSNCAACATIPGHFIWRIFLYKSFFLQFTFAMFAMTNSQPKTKWETTRIYFTWKQENSHVTSATRNLERKSSCLGTNLWSTNMLTTKLTLVVLVTKHLRMKLIIGSIGNLNTSSKIWIPIIIFFNFWIFDRKFLWFSSAFLLLNRFRDWGY